MTAEVAILNTQGVALAADSAVTISQSGKIYNSAQKLFRLGDQQPIGMMIYGNSHFMGIPHETLIKDFCHNNLKNTTLPSLVDYFDKYIEYLHTLSVFDEKSISLNAYNILRIEFDSIHSESAKNHIKCLFNGEPHTKDLAESKIIKNLEHKIEYLLQNQHEKSKKEAISLKKYFANEIIKAAEYSLGISHTSKKVRSLILNFGSLVLSKKDSSSISSGIVIAGVGNDEYFPSLKCIETDGFIKKNSIKITKEQTRCISQDQIGLVIPFAQPDMAYRFMEGIDNNLIVYITEQLVRHVENTAKSIIKNISTKSEIQEAQSALVEIVKNTVDEFLDQFSKHRRKEFVDPILSIVASLPKDELGHFSESLVSLASLKRRISTDRETVGGPIDVAVISKGDGFVWIKKKH